MATFSMKEFIALHKLSADYRNPNHTRLIAAKLKAKGFARVQIREGKKVRWVWTNERKDAVKIKDLKSQLASIKL